MPRSFDPGHNINAIILDLKKSKVLSRSMILDILYFAGCYNTRTNRKNKI